MASCLERKQSMSGESLVKALLSLVLLICLFLSYIPRPTSQSLSFAAEIPGAGGTVPPQGHAIWLPIVSRLVYTSSACRYHAVALEPTHGAIVYGDSVTLRWAVPEAEHAGPPDTEAVRMSRNSDLSGSFGSDHQNYWNKPRETTMVLDEPGTYYWRAEIRCAMGVPGVPSETFMVTLHNGP